MAEEFENPTFGNTLKAELVSEQEFRKFCKDGIKDVAIALSKRSEVPTFTAIKPFEVDNDSSIANLLSMVQNNDEHFAHIDPKTDNGKAELAILVKAKAIAASEQTQNTKIIGKVQGTVDRAIDNILDAVGRVTTKISGKKGVTALTALTFALSACSYNIPTISIAPKRGEYPTTTEISPPIQTPTETATTKPTETTTPTETPIPTATVDIEKQKEQQLIQEINDFLEAKGKYSDKELMFTRVNDSNIAKDGLGAYFISSENLKLNPMFQGGASEVILFDARTNNDYSYFLIGTTLSSGERVICVVADLEKGPAGIPLSVWDNGFRSNHSKPGSRSFIIRDNSGIEYLLLHSQFNPIIIFSTFRITEQAYTWEHSHIPNESDWAKFKEALDYEKQTGDTTRNFLRSEAYIGLPGGSTLTPGKKQDESYILAGKGKVFSIDEWKKIDAEQVSLPNVTSVDIRGDLGNW